MRTAILILAAIAAFAQVRDTYPRTPAVLTVATLPASPATNTRATISDGASATDCTTGGGSTVVDCRYTGSAWTAAPGGSGSGTVSGTTGALAAFTSSTAVGDATAGSGVTVTAGEVAVDDAVIPFKFISPSTDPGSTACASGDTWTREDTDEVWACTDSTPTWTKMGKSTHAHAASDVTSGTVGTARLGSGTADNTTFLRGDQTWAVPSGGSSVDPLTTLTMVDDFMCGTVEAGEIGCLNWGHAGGSSQSFATGLVAGHPGVFRKDTTTTINTVSTLFLPDTNRAGFVPSDTFDMTWVVRANSAVATDQTLRVGINCINSGISTTAQPTDGLYFEYIGGTDTNWARVSRASSAETKTDHGVAFSNTTWIRFRIRRKDASTIGFAINGGTEADVTTNIPTAACNPWAMITNTTGANKILDIDLFTLTITGLSR